MDLKAEDGCKESKEYLLNHEIVMGKRMLMKHLVLSSLSSRHTLQKLLETLNSRGLHDRGTRNQAAMIVERLAFNINLEEFPQGIRYISSMLETFGQYSIAEPHERDCLYDEQGGQEYVPRQLLPPDDKLWKPYKELVLQGLSILLKLAKDENNRIVMSNTRDLLPKIMSPVKCNLLDHDTDGHGGAWSDIVEASVKVIDQLTGAPGEVGAKLCHGILMCQGAISTLQRILSCSKCKNEMQLSAIRILTRLSRDSTESSRPVDFVLKGESRVDFVRTLLHIFTDDNKPIPIREYAGNALAELLSFGGGSSDAKIVIKASKRVVGDEASGDVVDSLTKILAEDRSEICRQAGAEILKHLCTHYTENDIYLVKLKKSILEVLIETLGCGKEADIENQRDNDRGQGISSLMHSVSSATFLSSLLSLCWTVYDVFNSELGKNLAPEFDASRFVSKLNEMVVIISSNPSAEKLLQSKAIGRLVILMMKRNNGRFVQQEDLRSLINALSTASKKMLDVDYYMVFSSADSNCATTSSKLNRRTFASLMREAREVYALNG